MARGFKHLIRCRCTLPQFKNMASPPQHMFVVFSVINDDDSVEPKFAQCNNCGIVHKVIDICKSEFTSKETMTSLMSIDDVKVGLNPKLVSVLERYDVDLPTWEAVKSVS